MRRSYRRERYLGWLDGSAGDPRDRRVDRHHRGVPGRDRGGLRRHARRRRARAVRQRVHLPVLATAGHARGARWRTRSRRRSCRSASTGWSRCRADHARADRAQVGATFEVLVEGAGKKDGSTQARTRTNRIVHLRRRAASRARSSQREITEAARAPPRRRARVRAGRRDRRGRPCMTCARSRWSARPPSARPRPRDRARDRARRRVVSVDSMLVYRGMDVGTAKPSPAERRARAAPPPRPRGAVGAVHGGAVPVRGRGAVLGRGAATAPGRRVRPLLPGGGRRAAVPAGGPRGPRGPRSGGRRAGRRAAVPAAGRQRPGGRRSQIEPGNVRRTSGRWRCRRSPARRSASSPRRGSSTTPRGCGPPASASDTSTLDARVARPCRVDARRRLARARSRAWSSAGSAPGSPPVRRSATLSLPRHLDGRLALDEAMTADREAHDETSRGGRWRGSAAIRASEWFEAGDGRRRRDRRRRAGVPGGARDATALAEQVPGERATTS